MRISDWSSDVCSSDLGPRGETSHGRWEFLQISEPSGYDVLDAFADDTGAVSSEMPATRMTFAFSATDAGSQLRSVTYFDSVEALEQLTAMGMVEGATMAMRQLDAELRAEARRGGQEWVRTCRSRVVQCH